MYRQVFRAKLFDLQKYFQIRSFDCKFTRRKIFSPENEMISISTPELSSKLSTAASFYKFSNIKTNLDKAALITNDPEALARRYIEVSINGVIHRIRVTPHGRLERFLGVYINFGPSKKPLINKLRHIVYNAAFCLYKKLLTHYHIRYIYNRVIIPKIEPKIEYIMQTTILTSR